jgi:hypothetical protein
LPTRTLLIALFVSFVAPGPARAADLVAVRVETEPQGAVIYVDGMPRGETPASLALPTGEHELFLHKAGFMPARRKVVWNAGERPSLRETLRPQRGGLVVVVDPPGSRVYFDDRLLGVTPLAYENLPTGEHQLSVRRDGFEPYVAFLTVSGTEPKLVTARLEGPPVSLFIEADSGSHVYVDGSFAGEVTSGSLNLRVRAGVHELRIEKNNFASVQRLTLEPGSDAFVGSGEMVRMPGLLGKDQAVKLEQRWYLVAGSAAVALGGAVLGVTSALAASSARKDYEQAFRRADIAAAKDRIRTQNVLAAVGAGVALLGAGGAWWAWPPAEAASVSVGPKGASVAWRF